MASVLPRKRTGVSRARDLLGAAAFQIGTLVAIERNRRGWTQEEVALQVGLVQVDVSKVENGEHLPRNVRDREIDKLFEELNLPDILANFVRWWRDNG